MSNVFDYKFNIGGNLLAKMEGMIDSTGRFRAKIEDCNNWLGRLSNTFAALDMASNYVENINGAIEAASKTTAGKMASMRDSIEEAKVSFSMLRENWGYG